MQLPHTLSPVLCCLLALGAQHVAGLVTPGVAPGVGAEVGLNVEGPAVRAEVEGEAGPRLTGGKAQRRQVLEPGAVGLVALGGIVQGEAKGPVTLDEAVAEAVLTLDRFEGEVEAQVTLNDARDNEGEVRIVSDEDEVEGGVTVEAPQPKQVALDGEAKASLTGGRAQRIQLGRVETETEAEATTETEADVATETDAITETEADAATETDADVASQTDANVASQTDS